MMYLKQIFHIIRVNQNHQYIMKQLVRHDLDDQGSIRSQPANPRSDHDDVVHSGSVPSKLFDNPWDFRAVDFKNHAYQT